MGGQISDILFRHHKYTLKIRAQDALIQTIAFRIIWEAASGPERQKVLQLIKAVDVKGIRHWLMPENLTIRALRQLAQNEHVLNYSRLDKKQLRAALKLKGIL